MHVKLKSQNAIHLLLGDVSYVLLIMAINIAANLWPVFFHVHSLPCLPV